MLNSNSRAFRRGVVRKRQGVSLFEVLCSISILLIAMLAISILLNNAVRSAGNARNRTIASIVCTSRLAAIKAGDSPSEKIGRWHLCGDPFPEWRYRWEIEPGPLPSIQQVTVSVAKYSSQGQVVFTTALTQYMAQADAGQLKNVLIAE